MRVRRSMPCAFVRRSTGPSSATNSSGIHGRDHDPTPVVLCPDLELGVDLEAVRANRDGGDVVEVEAAPARERARRRLAAHLHRVEAVRPRARDEHGVRVHDPVPPVVAELDCVTCLDRRPQLGARHRYERNTERPGYSASPPSASSIRSSWLYFATRSLRDGAPVLICPHPVATARSAIVVSSVSPERCDMTAV